MLGWNRFAAAAALVAALACGGPSTPPPPVLGQAPAFTLTERGGREISLDDLLGRPWVADFVFTHCAGPCPLLSTRMAALQRELGADTDVQLVSFTVDPERDTPEVLKKYAERYKADAEGWWFLTGPKQALYTMIRDGFKLAIDDGSALEDPEPGPGLITHSVRLVVVDPKGRVRAYIVGTEEGAVERVIEILDALARE